jgi:drug/metabolite transporter (DMT)-like permease
MRDMTQLKKDKWAIFLAFTAVYIVWGSTYLAIWIGLNDLPPFLMSALRFLVAGAILQCWCRWKGEDHADPSSIIRNAICGTLMLVGGTVSVVWAEQYLSSSLAAIIVTILPFWFVLLDKRQWRFYFSNKSIVAGLVLGFAGVTILLGFGNSSSVSLISNSNQWMGIVAILFGGFAWTMGSLYSKYRPAKTSLLVNGSIQLLSAGVFCLLISVMSGEFRNFSLIGINSSSWWALAYLIIMGSLVTYLCYLYLLKKKPLAQVSTYVYINPVVALLLGTLLANESITLLKVIALTIILTGVLLVNLPKYKFRST